MLHLILLSCYVRFLLEIINLTRVAISTKNFPLSPVLRTENKCASPKYTSWKVPYPHKEPTQLSDFILWPHSSTVTESKPKHLLAKQNKPTFSLLNSKQKITVTTHHTKSPGKECGPHLFAVICPDNNWHRSKPAQHCLLTSFCAGQLDPFVQKARIHATGSRSWGQIPHHTDSKASQQRNYFNLFSNKPPVKTPTPFLSLTGVEEATLCQKLDHFLTAWEAIFIPFLPPKSKSFRFFFHLLE